MYHLPKHQQIISDSRRVFAEPYFIKPWVYKVYLIANEPWLFYLTYF